MCGGCIAGVFHVKISNFAECVMRKITLSNWQYTSSLHDCNGYTDFLNSWLIVPASNLCSFHSGMCDSSDRPLHESRIPWTLTRIKWIFHKAFVCFTNIRCPCHARNCVYASLRELELKKVKTSFLYYDWTVWTYWSLEFDDLNAWYYDYISRKSTDL